MSKVREAIWNHLLPVSSAFTTREVAESANVAVSNASRDLASLEERGWVTKVKRGLWVMSGHPDLSPYNVVPYLFEGDEEEGYVSVLSALHLHGMIQQIPRVIHVVSKKQRPKLRTPIATYEFHQIHEKLFGGHKPYGTRGRFLIATPEKAVFDALYLSVPHHQNRFASLPELELPERFSAADIQHWIHKVEHPSMKKALQALWEDVAKRLGLLESA